MERLRKQLYSQDQPDADIDKSELSRPDDPDSPDDWQHDDKQPESHSFLNKLLVFAGIFCVLAAGFAVATFWFGDSGVSPNQVGISISGPKTISAGDTAEFTVSIRNNNQVPLEDASLTTVFPPGTREPDTSGEELRRIRQQLDTLSPGETRNVTVAASLFGQQDEVQTIDVQLEYRVPESNAIFSANDQYAVDIGELPVSISIESPKETAPGQPVTFDLNVQSNSAKPLDNVVLRANYPFGFSTTEISPEPQYRNYVWSLGKLQPGGTRDISIAGRFADSASGGQRTFGFSAGIASSQSSSSIGTLFADREAVMSLREPYIDLTLDLQNDSQDRPLVLSSGQSISGSLRYESNLDNPVSGAKIDLEFLGQGIDVKKVTSEEGLYRESESVISWSPQTTDQLGSVASGQSGSFAFSFTNKSSENLLGIENPTAEMRATLKADSPEGSDLPDTISVETNRTPRLHSDITVETASLHDTGPFNATGPIPPRVGETTEYTAHFTIRNSTNDLSDVNLQADVPAFVEIAEDPQTSTGSFTYNDVTGRLRWEIPKLPAGAGFDSSPAEIFIPLRVTPPSSEAENETQILKDVTVTGQDDFVGERLEVNSIDEPSTLPASAEESSESGSVQPRDN